MWRLSLGGRIIVFKSLATSKIAYLSLLTIVPNNTTEELIKIQKNFLWNFAAAKTKYSTTLMDYRNGGLKNVDVLFGNLLYHWKVIPLFFVHETFGDQLNSIPT